MSETKKPLPVCETENGKGDQIALEGFLISEKNSTIPKNCKQGISALLLHGETNAVPMSYLTSITGQTPREIRRQVQLERQAGVCICINNRDGYYLAETEAEREACARSMRRRALEVYKTSQAIERAEVERS